MPLDRVGQSVINEALDRGVGKEGGLGQVGNLRFTAGEGGTPRVGRPNLFQRIGHAIGRVFASPEQRAQKEVGERARSLNRGVGDLLGSLTVLPDDRKGLREAAAALTRLAGKLDREYGGMHEANPLLERNLAQLGKNDLLALWTGILGNAQSRDEMLGLVDVSQRNQAEALLKHVESSLRKEHFARVTDKPLTDIDDILAEPRTDKDQAARELAYALDELTLGLAQGEREGERPELGNREVLVAGLERLSDERLGRLIGSLSPELLKARGFGELPAIDRYLKLRGESEEDVSEQDIAGAQAQLLVTLSDVAALVAKERVESCVQGDLDLARTQLDTALKSGDQAGVVRALSGLSRAVGRAREEYARLGLGEPPQHLQAGWKASVKGVIDFLAREQIDRKRGLDAGALGRLDDDELRVLVDAQGELGRYGLDVPQGSLDTVMGLRRRLREQDG
jgi:hypothetical protein